MSPGTRRRGSGGPRAGFTLVELLVVVMIVGILAGLAVPNVRGAVLRADAARVVSDARAVGLAAYEYLSDNGRFPASGAPGEVPPELAETLGEADFQYKGLTYTWYGMDLGAGSGSGTGHLGVLMVEYGNQTAIGNALSAFAGPDHYWGPEAFYVLFWD